MLIVLDRTLLLVVSDLKPAAMSKLKGLLLHYFKGFLGRSSTIRKTHPLGLLRRNPNLTVILR